MNLPYISPINTQQQNININRQRQQYIQNMQSPPLPNTTVPATQAMEANDGYDSPMTGSPPPPVGPMTSISRPQHDWIDKLLERWVILNNHEFDIVEEQEFKDLLKYLCPAYQIPGRSMTGGRLLTELHHEIKKEVENVK